MLLGSKKPQRKLYRQNKIKFIHVSFTSTFCHCQFARPENTNRMGEGSEGRPMTQ